MHARAELVNVVGRDDVGNRGCQCGAWLAALVCDVGVGEHDQRDLFLRQVDRHGLVAGKAAVMADPSAEVEDAQAVSVLRRHAGGAHHL